MNSDKDTKDQQGTPAISSTTLFEGHRLLRIEHQGEYYTLRITANDKLILTK